ncbi:MAG: mannitol dehydrogenase family protein, partial [Hyphomicrobiales bacterium]|nr:mannitol dehydrogenase family protein [Hyphomicrobiales bacterium]
IDVRDPYAARLRALVDAARPDAGSIVASLLRVREIFGDDLAENRSFSEPVTSALELLLRVGARATVRQLS